MQQRWIRIEDRLPKPRQLVAVLVERRGKRLRRLAPMARIAYHTGGGLNGTWKERHSDAQEPWNYLEDVTHWAPIPPLPRRAKTGKTA